MLPQRDVANLMKTVVTVDDIGRLVLPKRIREAIGISGRTSLELEVVGSKLQITKKTCRAVRRKGGRLVSAQPLRENWDSGEAVLQMRERRMRRESYP